MDGSACLSIPDPFFDPENPPNGFAGAFFCLPLRNPCCGVLLLLVAAFLADWNAENLSDEAAKAVRGLCVWSRDSPSRTFAPRKAERPSSNPTPILVASEAHS